MTETVLQHRGEIHSTSATYITSIPTVTNDTHSPIDGPPAEELTQLFQVYEIEVESDRLLYYGEPLLNPDVVAKRLWPLFREHGYEVTLTTRRGEHVLVDTDRSVSTVFRGRTSPSPR